jgi:hypothetical protein
MSAGSLMPKRSANPKFVLIKDGKVLI